ncbi:MAG: hypothetical protein JKX81_01755 [Arenicella sp.]|nr:hypothetical protein [Arenicella sp.]
MSIAKSNADQNGSIELPSMTVYASKNSDDTYTQISEIAWVDANDPTIIAQKDGSYSPSSATNSYSLNMLLLSLGGPKINIDLGYAAGSASMTADGTRTVTKLLESLKYLNEGDILEVTPTLEASNQANKRLMQRRLEELSRVLSWISKLEFKIKPVKILRQSNVNAASSKTWRIQIRRAR